MNLVAQGNGMTAAHAAELSRLSGSPFGLIRASAYRFKVGARDPQIAPWCEARRIDHAFVADGQRFDRLKLVAMDMDSTLITIECIDELGDLAGKKAEIAAITAQAMRGEIAYPESLRKRVGLLAGLQEDALRRVYEERLRLTAGAEQLIAACKASGVKLLLVSGGFTYFTEKLKARLGLDYAISNVLESAAGKLTGRLTGDIVDAEAKAKRFQEVAKDLKAERAQTLAIGDGANDLNMMAQAGFSVAFRAKPVVQAQASCALNHSGLDGVLNLFEPASAPPISRRSP
ncbi:MAG TPA: phosphoserine phosphatase SerB [Burkholderiales bacterium]